MRKVQIDKFASATFRLQIPNPAPVSHDPYPKIGDVIVARALNENPSYPNLELTTGELAPIREGEVIAGVVGSRQALRGYVGYAPYRVRKDDVLAVLNIGGVIGRHLDGPADLGGPVRVKVLGLAMNGKEPFNMSLNAIKPLWSLPASAPIVLVAGSCMNVGKTETAVRLIDAFVRRGLKVSAAKLSGVAALKDVRRLEGAGAHRVLSFIDAGFPSTIDVEASEWSGPFKGIIAALNDDHPDLLVVELGDGILGRYRVDEIVSDENLMQFVAATIVCATDLAAAFGARETLNRLGLIPTIFSGPVTDTIAGSEYIEEKFGIPALNALKHADKMAGLLLDRVARFREAA
ncbi:MAG TPA: hypothetical protein VI643_02530 [Planctomycetota bacterium]|nr:hypothetical protein [Planctomycetota bacterium]